MQHRTVQALPEGTAQTGGLAAHRGEGGGRDHQLCVLALQQIPHAGLHRTVPQAAHPDQPGAEALLAQRFGQGRSQRDVTGLQQRSIEHHTHGRSWIVTPVPWQRVRQRFDGDPFRIGFYSFQKLLENGQQLLLIGRSSLAQQRGQSIRQCRLNGAQAMQFQLLVRCPRQHKKLPVRCIVLPSLQLLQSVTPVASAAQQTHQNQTGMAGRCCQVMVELSRMRQAIQTQGADPVLPIPPLQEQLIQAAEIRRCAGQEQHLRRGLLHERNIFRRVQTRAAGKAVHHPILPRRGPDGEKIQPPGLLRDASVPALRMVPGPVRPL